MDDLKKKQIRSVDLALQAARKRQSPRTGFVHLFHTDETAIDTVPIYENFCFALALFRQKNGDSVAEGKELLEKLLSFQTPDGNFPIYLHDYPRCFDFLLSLKIAPICIHLLHLFGSILGKELKAKIELALERMLSFADLKYAEKPFIPLWEARYRACKGESVPSFTPFTAQEWAEWIITAQIARLYRNELKNQEYAKEAPRFLPKHAGAEAAKLKKFSDAGGAKSGGCSTPAEIDSSGCFGIKTPLSIPYYSGMQVFAGSFKGDAQEREEPRPHLVEWLLAEQEEAFSTRLLRDHPHQLLCAPLFPIDPVQAPASLAILQEEGNFRLVWKGDRLHSLAAFKVSHIDASEKGAELLFDLGPKPEQERGDLIEAALFCNLSSETKLFINEQKANVFYFGDAITIRTPQLAIHLTFKLEGEGDFCGHISRANRPTQIACKGPLLYEAFDWKISLRTLRRENNCRIRVSIKTEFTQCIE